LRAGETYATPPAVPHAYRAISQGIWHICWTSYGGEGAHAWPFSIKTPTVLRAEVEPLRLAIEGLCACAGQADADASELALWAQLVHRRVTATLQPNLAADSQLGRLWARVNADLAHPWTLSELAREAALSREALPARVRSQSAARSHPPALATRGRVVAPHPGQDRGHRAAGGIW
jgi:hypothetical protein